MKYDGATIEILNWEKYNPRKDVKATTWFRCQNSLFEEVKFTDFDAADFAALLYILSMASKAQTHKITLNYAHAERFGRTPADRFDSVLERLKTVNFISINSASSRARNVDVTRTSRARNVDVTPTGKDVTLRTNERTYETRRDVRTNEQVTERAKKNRKPHDESDASSYPNKTESVWFAYSDAYRVRYGTDPVRNAKVNSQLAQLTKRLGEEEAPRVAAFYVTHNAAFYVKAMHAIGPLLADAEKLRTEWVTGQKMLGMTAQHVERSEHIADVWGRAFETVRKKLEEASNENEGEVEL
jgi:hypothetical protein